MFSVEVVGADKLDALLKAYPKIVTRAMVRAMNRGIQGSRTLMVRSIAQDLGAPSTQIRNALIMREATFSNLEAKLAASLKRLPISAFNPRGPVPSRGKGRGVTYRLKGSRGRIPNAFIATMGGHLGVFARKGKARFPVRELFGPSIGHVFGKYRAAGIERARQVFRERFRHETTLARREAGLE